MQIVDGLRATDDGLVFVVVNKLRLHTFKIALAVLRKIKKEFVKNMGGKTVPEFDQVSLLYTYLENIIFNVYTDILVSFNNKNHDSLIEAGVQVIIKGAHKDSLTSTEIKISTLFQTFLRIKERCMLDCLAHSCALKFIYMKF